MPVMRYSSMKRLKILKNLECFVVFFHVLLNAQVEKIKYPLISSCPSWYWRLLDCASCSKLGSDFLFSVKYSLHNLVLYKIK